MRDNEKKFSLPMLPEPRTLRVRFRKVGNLQYISHLDLQRTFSRVLVRAGLPLWYTKGFNPHIKMVFGMPLSVGAESECEFLDIRIEREMSESEVLTRLNEALTDELRATAVYPARRKFSEIAYAAYTFTITTTGGDSAMAARMGEALKNEPLIVSKRSKSGVKEVDVREFIHSATVSEADGVITIEAVLAAGEGKYLSPELIVTALREKLGILSGDPTRECYRILRHGVYLADGITPFA